MKKSTERNDRSMQPDRRQNYFVQRTESNVHEQDKNGYLADVWFNGTRFVPIQLKRFIRNTWHAIATIYSIYRILIENH